MTQILSNFAFENGNLAVCDTGDTCNTNFASTAVISITSPLNLICLLVQLKVPKCMESGFDLSLISSRWMLRLVSSKSINFSHCDLTHALMAKFSNTSPDRSNLSSKVFLWPIGSATTRNMVRSRPGSHSSINYQTGILTRDLTLGPPPGRYRRPS